MIRRVEKQLKSFTEAGIRHMEKIDSLVIFSESTSDEQKQRNREKRKSLINGIQDLLNKNDKYVPKYYYCRDCPKILKSQIFKIQKIHPIQLSVDIAIVDNFPQTLQLLKLWKT